MGEVNTDVEFKQESDNTVVEDVLKTNFFIEKYFGDVTDENDRQLIGDVIPMGPNADPDKKVQFKIWSDHSEEYVHLEECELVQEDQNGNIVYKEVFMRDGCVEKVWEHYFDNSDRESPTINEDWFNMKPLVVGCKTKWHIKCKTASCKRGLETENEEAFNAYCSVSDLCTSRNYLSSLLNDPLSNVHTSRRRRRDTEDGSVDEDIVESVVEHPCYFVDTITTSYCTKDQCWTLTDCAKAFPADFPDFAPSESDEDAKLDEIIETIRDLFEDHIKEITDEPSEEEEFMAKIADQAQLVLAATHTIEDVVDQLIATIAKRNA